MASRRWDDPRDEVLQEHGVHRYLDTEQRYKMLADLDRRRRDEGLGWLQARRSEMKGAAVAVVDELIEMWKEDHAWPRN